MIYAIAIVAERDIPAKQCTNTRPFDAFAFSTQQRNWQVSNSAALHHEEKFAKKAMLLKIVQNFQTKC